MYVYIYEIPENFLKQIITELVSRYGTLVICTQKFQKNRGQGRAYLILP